MDGLREAAVALLEAATVVGAGGHALVPAACLAALEAAVEREQELEARAVLAEETRAERLVAAGGWEWAIGGAGR